MMKIGCLIGIVGLVALVVGILFVGRFVMNAQNAGPLMTNSTLTPGEESTFEAKAIPGERFSVMLMAILKAEPERPVSSERLRYEVVLRSGEREIGRQSGELVGGGGKQAEQIAERLGKRMAEQSDRHGPVLGAFVEPMVVKDSPITVAITVAASTSAQTAVEEATAITFPGDSMSPQGMIRTIGGGAIAVIVGSLLGLTGLIVFIVGAVTRKPKPPPEAMA